MYLNIKLQLKMNMNIPMRKNISEKEYSNKLAK